MSALADLADTGVVTLDDEVRRIEALLLADDADARAAVPRPPERASTVARLVTLFGLSPFETDVLVLAAACELDGRVARLVGELTGGSGHAIDPRPTFGLALATCPDPHWDALSPARPLRRWRLVVPGAGPTSTTRRLGVDEQVLHTLTGTATGLGELAGVVADVGPPDHVAPSHARLADSIAATVATGPRVLVRLVGDGRPASVDVARAVAIRLGHVPVVVHADALPPRGPDLARLAPLLERHLRLHDGLPVVVGEHAALAEHLDTHVVMTTDDGEPPLGRTELRWAIGHPPVAERVRLWRDALDLDLDDDGEGAVDVELAAAVDAVAGHHRFDAATIAAVATELAGGGGPSPAGLRAACRARGRAALDGLAEQVDVRAGWDDIVLPEGAATLLRDLVHAVEQRTVVHERWGFAASSTRGLGVTALFAGDSGTGKTMAAEVVAGELDVDLFRIDLASVVDKYIGETEKHLSRLFDAAEHAGAVLLFDEADALFGKRGDVRDAHDRYANLEVSYLLQRMETYRGLAVLTTNLRSNVDRAFLRRLRFVVEFPFPGEDQRAAIWARVFPPATPTVGIEPAALARLRVAGGSIRAIALAAAVAAAAEGRAVHPEHVLHAARVEYAKTDRALSHAETVAITGGAP